MSLKDRAAAEAADRASRQRQDTAARRTADGNDLVERFTTTFGLDATWAGCGDEVAFRKEYPTFGEPYMKGFQVHRHRLLVDDVQLGFQRPDRYSAGQRIQVDPKVIYLSCPRCGVEYGFPLNHVNTYGDDVAKHQASLIAAIGEVVHANAPCGSCTSPPCRSCGRSWS